MMEDKDQHTRGIGDIVEWITEKSGIKFLVKRVYGEDCGCGDRKDKWNKIKFDPFKHYSESVTRINDNGKDK